MASGGQFDRGFQKGKLFALRAHHRLLDKEITHEEFSALMSEELRSKRLTIIKGRAGRRNEKVEETGYIAGILSYRKDMGV